jgi:hypothetical protein
MRPRERQRRQVVHGANRNQLLTPRCAVCGKFVALRVDPEDAERRAAGLFVQDAYADADGNPYLTPAEREILISSTCGACYLLLCPDPITHPTTYN